MTTRHKRPMKSLLLGQGAEVCDPSFTTGERFKLPLTLYSIPRMETQIHASTTQKRTQPSDLSTDQTGERKIRKDHQTKAHTQRNSKSYFDLTSADLDARGSRSFRTLAARLRKTCSHFRHTSRLNRKKYRNKVQDFGRKSGITYSR